MRYWIFKEILFLGRERGKCSGKYFNGFVEIEPGVVAWRRFGEGDDACGMFGQGDRVLDEKNAYFVYIRI